MKTLLIGGGFWKERIEIIEPPGSVAAIAGRILGAIQAVAFAIAVGMLIVMGMKYMLAAADEKAELKKATINYFIGAIIVFGASTIFRILVDFAYSMVN